MYYAMDRENNKGGEGVTEKECTSEWERAKEKLKKRGEERDF